MHAAFSIVERLTLRFEALVDDNSRYYYAFVVAARWVHQQLLLHLYQAQIYRTSCVDACAKPQLGSHVLPNIV
jgi:hypothetical protein